MKAYTVGITGPENYKGVALYHHDTKEVTEMVETILRQEDNHNKTVWIEIEELPTKEYIQKNLDNLTLKEQKILSAKGRCEELDDTLYHECNELDIVTK